MIDEQKRVALIEAAQAVRQHAYAPYSRYLVGAALLTANGRIVTGCNVENASYGLAMCAERTAVFKMVSDGERQITAVAVATENGGSPCGACRQVLAEFAGDIPVLLVDKADNVRMTTLHTLLPDHFGPEDLLTEA